MPRRSYPLTLILRAHGPAELVNSEEEILWASDSDDDFREEFNDEFLQEEDIGDILEYLYDSDIISDKEMDFFESEHWDCDIETLADAAGEPEDDDDGAEEDDEG
jgi:hypothetical protein